MMFLVLSSLLQMTFLCEYRVNRGDVWTHPSLPSYSPDQQDDHWQLSTIAPPTTSTTTEKTTKPTSATFSTPRPTLFSLFDFSANPMEENSLEESETVLHNQIEVITRDKSSVVFHQKKDNTIMSETLQPDDDTSWSIFQFLKNVIKMPAILSPTASYV